MNFLIAIAALYGGLNSDVEPPKKTSQLAVIRILSNESPLVSTREQSRPLSPVRGLDLRRTLSLVIEDSFTGGAGMSGSIQPVRWMRMEGGLVQNSVRPGLEIGMTYMPFELAFIPFDLSLVPSVSVEIGHYFPKDAASVLSALSTNAKLDCSRLQNFSHDTDSGYLGLDVGHGPLALSIRGGFTHTEVSNLDMSRVFEVSVPGLQAPSPPRKQLATGPSGKLVLTVRL